MMSTSKMMLAMTGAAVIMMDQAAGIMMKAEQAGYIFIHFQIDGFDFVPYISELLN